MKLLKHLFVTGVGLALSVATSQATLSLDFSSTLGSSIQFNGASSSFQFNSSTISPFSGSQFYISSGGSGSAIGLQGVFNNGPFTYGAITSAAGEESATVTGPLAGMVIADGLGNNLTGNVNWVEISTFDFAGGVNASLTINLTDLAYAGLNQDLKALVAGSNGALDLTFQFSPGKTLSDLTSGTGPYDTSFSGSLSVQTAIPEVNQVYAIFFLLLILSVTPWLRRLAVK
jgi:hypothetical protein